MCNRLSATEEWEILVDSCGALISLNDINYLLERAPDLSHPMAVGLTEMRDELFVNPITIGDLLTAGEVRAVA